MTDTLNEAEPLHGFANHLRKWTYLVGDEFAEGERQDERNDAKKDKLELHGHYSILASTKANTTTTCQ